MQTVRLQTPPADYASICAITENNRAYPFPGLGSTFPKEEERFPNYTFRDLKPLDLARELALQVARINYHATKIVPALESLGRINEHFVQRNTTDAEIAIRAHRDAHGLSLVLIKKDLLLSLEKQSLPGLALRCKAMTNDYQRTGWSLLCHYVYDMMDPTYNAGRASRVWLQACRKRMDIGEWYCRVVEDDVLLVSPTDTIFSAAILRFSALSLLDLVLLIWRKRAACPEHAQLQTACRGLDRSILAVLADKFSTLEIEIPDAYAPSDKSPSDIDVFRLTFFFDEISAVTAWRSHINRLRFAELIARPGQDDVSKELDDATTAIAIAPGVCAEKVLGLSAWEKSFLCPGAEIADQKFLTATLVAETLRKIANGTRTDAASITHLLVSTEDIQFFVSLDLLNRLLKCEPAISSPPLYFVLLEMIYRQERTADNELERRIAFMKLFRGVSGTKMVEILDEIVAIDYETAILLAKTCTRTFLERLYLMMTSVKEVLETRLRICAWLENHAKEDAVSLKEEIDALERELANLDARSDLDSTRVHVDEESLREWFKATQLINVARYIQTVVAEGPVTDFGSLIDYYNKEKEPKNENFVADTKVGSESLLIAIFDSTLSAFVADRTFGLDAYLSRRIRHGTLSGHVITPVARALKRLSEHSHLHDQVHDSKHVSDIDARFEEWRKYLVNDLDYIRKDIIQIKTLAHPKGLILANWQTVSNIAHFDAMIARVRSRVIESAGIYDVFPDIYSLCWDCLESDLAQLRLYMMREFYPAAIDRLTNIFDHLPYDARPIARPYVQIVQDTLRDRVQQVCGWFIRPVFRRDRYSLKMLTLSTLSIVRELDDRHAFTEEVTISDGISLNRGSFDVFGDMLFVLIHNAARHGKVDGRIKISATESKSAVNMVVVDVTSEVTDFEKYREAILRIQSALQMSEEQAIARAAVEEGFSGLRKLGGIIRRVRSPDVQLRLIGSGEKLQITFRLTLPAEITVTRDRS
jgi:hypothetical protein